MHHYSGSNACSEHSNFFKVNVLATQDTLLEASGENQLIYPRDKEHVLETVFTLGKDPTTSFLTATVLVYAIGAGITAAAGTRLALQ